MKKYCIPIIFMVSILSIQRAISLNMASITLEKFINSSETIAEAKLVRAESSVSENTYIFQITETFKGPVLKSVTIKAGTYYHGYTICPGSTCFIALKMNNGNWEFAVMGRSCWAVKYELKPDHQTILRVVIDDHLIRDIPKSLKKEALLMTRLANGKYHKYIAEIYLLDDIRKFLRKKFKK